MQWGIAKAGAIAGARSLARGDRGWGSATGPEADCCGRKDGAVGAVGGLSERSNCCDRGRGARTDRNFGVENIDESLAF